MSEIKVVAWLVVFAMMIAKWDTILRVGLENYYLNKAAAEWASEVEKAERTYGRLERSVGPYEAGVGEAASVIASSKETR